MINTDPWSAEEDTIVRRMREEGKSWDLIIHRLPGRSKDTIKTRCEQLGCSIHVRAVGWTADEIEALRAALLSFEGQEERSWKKIAEQVLGRTAKECRNRVFNERRRCLDSHGKGREEEDLAMRDSRSSSSSDSGNSSGSDRSDCSSSSSDSE